MLNRSVSAIAIRLAIAAVALLVIYSLAILAFKLTLWSSNAQIVW
ncbi:MAG TPA: hypothetical protein VMV72_16850 [Verrucomicrobiae bacterium]|nr:hypothetical protein [Verrucomicrobiae bacterium]